MTTIDNFVQVIAQMLEVFDDLITVENQKLDAVSANDVDSLEKFMNQEQVFIMKIKGIEQKRVKIQQELGYDQFSFREVIEACDNDYKFKLNSMYNELSQKTIELKSAAESTHKHIEINLNSIDAIISAIGDPNIKGSTYLKSGAKNTIGGSKSTNLKA